MSTAIGEAVGMAFSGFASLIKTMAVIILILLTVVILLIVHSCHDDPNNHLPVPAVKKVEKVLTPNENSV